MKSRQFWDRISNLSAYTCGVIAILHTFFRQYFLDIIEVFVAIEIVTICLFLFAESMKFIKRKRNE